MNSPLPARLPCVDGWRVVCITLVLAWHSHFDPRVMALCQMPWLAPLFQGNLGVRCFFVISGFLITYLLLREHADTGHISLRSFYLRRAIRILPVYGAYLAVIGLLQLWAGFKQAPVTWLGDLTFTVNFLPRGRISGHLWSLAIEEQFYTVWPVVLIWLLRSRDSRWFAAAFALPVISTILFSFIGWTGHYPFLIHPLFHEHSSFVNFDSLGMGCLAAFGLTRHQPYLRNFLVGGRLLAVILLGGSMVLLPVYGAGSGWPVAQALSAILGRSIQAAGAAMLLVTSVIRPDWFRPLNWAPVAYLGVLSYSIYIWQQPFSTSPAELNLPFGWYYHFPIWLVCSLVVAVVSYHCLERPLMALRSRWRPTPSSVATSSGPSA